MARRATIGTWGTSLAVRIPQLIADQLQLKAGSELKISCKDNYLIFEAPKTNDQKFDEFLEELLNPPRSVF